MAAKIMTRIGVTGKILRIVPQQVGGHETPASLFFSIVNYSIALTEYR